MIHGFFLMHYKAAIQAHRIYVFFNVCVATNFSSSFSALHRFPSLNTIVPNTADTVDDSRMENLARFRSPGSIKAMDAMKMDMVNPMPPQHACRCQFSRSGSARQRNTCDFMNQEYRSKDT